MMSHTLVGFIQIIKEEKFLVALIFKNGSVGDVAFSGKEEIFTKSPDMADSCQQDTPFPPTAFLWFGFNMIPRQCQRRNLCCDG